MNLRIDALRPRSRRTASTLALGVAGLLAASVPYAAAVVTLGLRRFGVVINARLARPWWPLAIATLAWSVSPLLRGDLPGAARAALEFAALSLILVGAIDHGAQRRASRVVQALAAGALVVVMGMALLSVYHLLATTAGAWPELLPRRLPFGPHPLAYPGRASGWMDHPNFWGAWAALLAVATAQLHGGRLLGPAGLAAAAVVVALAGSRGAAAALLVGVVVLLFGTRLKRRVKLALLTGVGVALSIWVVTSPFGARLDPGALLELLRAPAATPPNLFVSSEDVLRDRSAWHRSTVAVEAGGASLAGDAVVTLVKTSEAPAARVYQAVRLTPGSSYTMSADLRPAAPEQRAGLAGWGRQDATTPHDTVNAVLLGGEVSVSSAGEIDVVSFGSRPQANGWYGVHVSFIFLGPAPLTWLAGPTVDQRPDERSLGSRLDVRRLQLVEGEALLPYAPTTLRVRQQREAQAAVHARLAAYRQALVAIGDRPLVGWWDVPFGEAVAAVSGESAAARSTHAHNLLLDVAYRHGLVGVAALAVVLVYLVHAGLTRHHAGLAPVATLLALNVFDSLFWALGFAHMAAFWLVLTPAIGPAAGAAATTDPARGAAAMTEGDRT